MSKDFCTRPSRLFSGDPSALFGPDTQFRQWGLSFPAGVSSPYSIQLDTEQAADSQFWNIPQMGLMIFTGDSSFDGSISSFSSVLSPRLYLCPNNLVGTRVQDPTAGHLNGVNPNNLGIPIASSGAFGFLNDVNTADGGMYQDSWAAFTNIVVPPKWFLRLVLFNNGNSALPLFPGATTLNLKAAVEVIPLDFTSAP